MWTKAKSATLSLICTRILIGAAIAVAAAIPFVFPGYNLAIESAGGLIKFNMYISYVFSALPGTIKLTFYICAYATFAFAMIALFSLDRLLRNIRNEIVFTQANVKYLRIISWCCFAIAIIMLCSWPQIHYVLIFVAAAAAFFGIMIRVVKNVIETACEIKDENDFTI
jgi:hypothetical protein